jgi:hypothetical protein
MRLSSRSPTYGGHPVLPHSSRDRCLTKPSVKAVYCRIYAHGNDFAPWFWAGDEAKSAKLRVDAADPDVWRVESYLCFGTRVFSTYQPAPSPKPLHLVLQGVSDMLMLPLGFGNIYLGPFPRPIGPCSQTGNSSSLAGETFRGYVSVSNHSAKAVSRVTLKDGLRK